MLLGLVEARVVETTAQIRRSTAGCGDLRRSPPGQRWDPELGRRGWPAAFERTAQVQLHIGAQALRAAVAEA